MSEPRPVAEPPSRSVAWAWFFAWAVIGCAVVLGLISFVVIFVVAIIPLAGLAIWMAMRPSSQRSAFGLLAGAGSLFLYVAWVQRDGPGTTCWQTATGGGCEEHLNPIPWLVIGVVLVAAAIAGQAWSLRSQPHPQRPE